MSSAVVVGGGPNGLAAAVTLAKAGMQVTVLEAADEISGGARSSEAIIPGLLHDHCSAIHPMAVGSPFYAGLGLEAYGLSWCLPDIDCVHPLDDGSAGVLYRSVDTTADGLGRDGTRWRRLFGWTSARFDALAEDIMRPLLGIPHHPLVLARFGAPPSRLRRLAITRRAGPPGPRSVAGQPLTRSAQMHVAATLFAFAAPRLAPAPGIPSCRPTPLPSAPMS